jgi:hypothetical protein
MKIKIKASCPFLQILNKQKARQNLAVYTQVFERNVVKVSPLEAARAS